MRPVSLSLPGACHPRELGEVTVVVDHVPVVVEIDSGRPKRRAASVSGLFSLRGCTPTSIHVGHFLPFLFLPLSCLQMLPFDIITSLECWLNGTVIGFNRCKHMPGCLQIDGPGRRWRLVVFAGNLHDSSEVLIVFGRLLDEITPPLPSSCAVHGRLPTFTALCRRPLSCTGLNRAQPFDQAFISALQ